MIRAIVIVAALVACKGKDAPAPSPASGSPEAKPDPIASFGLPEIKDGFEPVTGDSIAVVVSPTEIVVDGKSIVPLENGVARPEDREGGAMGMKLPRLSTMLASHAELSKDRRLKLVVHKTVPYRTLIEVMYSAKQKEAGYTQFQILARSNGRFVMAPITLPDRNQEDAVAHADLLVETGRQPGGDLAKQIEGVREGKPTKPPAKSREVRDEEAARLADLLTGGPEPAGGTKPGGDLAKQIDDVKHGGAAKPAGEQPVKLVVALTKTATLLWSMSGLEGTLANPKLQLPAAGDLAALRAAVDEIVQRRWAGKKESAERSILIMADGDIPMQRIAEAIAAVRPAFPDINFGTGFE